MTESGFLMDVGTLELFFRICRRYKVDAREPRLALLGLLAKRKKAQYLRDISVATAGKKVLRIERKRNDNAN